MPGSSVPWSLSLRSTGSRRRGFAAVGCPHEIVNDGVTSERWVSRTNGAAGHLSGLLAAASTHGPDLLSEQPFLSWLLGPRLPLGSVTCVRLLDYEDGKVEALSSGSLPRVTGFRIRVQAVWLSDLKPIVALGKKKKAKEKRKKHGLRVSRAPGPVQLQPQSDLKGCSRKTIQNSRDGLGISSEKNSSSENIRNIWFARVSCILYSFSDTSSDEYSGFILLHVLQEGQSSLYNSVKRASDTRQRCEEHLSKKIYEASPCSHAYFEL
ncbi:hypothetical protein MJT46_018070 [Ovis ammon polii x Ovis aries]|nr:hypothetical protein MJT46_018070 [Ovis ammon polii x Ovis aries]